MTPLAVLMYLIALYYLMVIISFWSVSVWSEDFYETWLSNESPVKQNLRHKSF